MKKGLVIGIIVIFLALFVIQFVSASSFWDFWNKLTGRAVNETCTSNCTVAGKQCFGNHIKSCEDRFSTGCLNWWWETYCPHGCSDGECVSLCINNCSSSGQKQCFGNTVKTCVTGADGCLNWDSGFYCSNGCSDGACVPPFCPDPCSYSGQKQCEGNYIETCIMTSADCLNYYNSTYCPYGCSNGACLNATTSCTNNCSYVGQKQCFASNPYYAFAKTCVNTTGGCLNWDSGIYCGGSCLDGKCGCPGNCTVNGQKQCRGRGNDLLTCSDYFSNGCLNLWYTSNCPYGCSNGACLNSTTSGSSSSGSSGGGGGSSGGGGGSSSFNTTGTGSSSGGSSNATGTSSGSNATGDSSAGSSSGGGGGMIQSSFTNQISQENIVLYINPNITNYPAPNISVTQAISHSDFTEQQISSVSLNIESDKVVYLISGTKQGKLVAVVPVEVKIEQKIDAVSGETLSVRKSWWAFLTFGIH